MFNSTGKMIRSEDKQGNQVTYTYDVSGNLDYLTDTQGRQVDFSYTSGLLDTITDVVAGRVFDYNYAQFAGDPTYRLASSTITNYDLETDTVNVGATTSYDYDSAGRLIEVTDPENNRTQVGYDGATRRVSTIKRVTASSTTPDPTTTFTYPASDPSCAPGRGVTKVDGPRTDVTDVTTYCLDVHDRVAETTDAKGHQRATTYTPNSNVETFNDSGGGGLPYEYGWSDDDNLETVTLPGGGQSTAAYDDTSTNPHFPTGVRDFATADADPTTWAYDYDPKGHLIEAENTEEAVTFRYCYDGKGLLQRIDAPPVTTTLDNSTTTGCGTATQGNDTLFSYDTAGNLTQVDPPGTHGTQTFTHDPVSRIKTMTDGRGVVTTYSYDALDRITKLAFTGPGGIGGVSTIRYDHDAAGNMVERNDATGQTDFTFDELNRMTREAPDEHGESVSYDYDTASNMTDLDASEEPGSVSYSYDNLNRTTGVSDQRNRTTSFGYNTRDMRISTVYPNGVTMKQAFDGDGNLSCIYGYTGTAPTVDPDDDCPAASTSLLSFFSYTYVDPANDRKTTTRYSETNRDGHVTDYSYDDLTRLERATTMNGMSEVRDYEYAMEPRGNITRETVTGTGVPNTVTSFAYTENNELCWTATGTHTSTCATTPSGATTYGYDDAGNLTSSSDGLSAGYNLQGQTAQITPPGGGQFTMAYADATSDLRTEAGEQRFTYNQLGLGSQGENSGTDQETWFVRDPQGTLISLVNDDTGHDDLFYLYDGLGSIAATTDEQGNLETRYTYEPYGEQITPDPTLTYDGKPADKNPWRYASGYYDTTTGMLKFGTRYYMPNLMRWTQPDPVMGKPANPMSLNPYAYVGCNPTNNTDPSSRESHGDLFALGVACLEAGGLGATFGGGFSSFILPGLGTLGGAALGFAYGCPAGMIAQGATGYNPFTDPQGVF